MSNNNNNNTIAAASLLAIAILFCSSKAVLQSVSAQARKEEPPPMSLMPDNILNITVFNRIVAGDANAEGNIQGYMYNQETSRNAKISIPAVPALFGRRIYTSEDPKKLKIYLYNRHDYTGCEPIPPPQEQDFIASSAGTSSTIGKRTYLKNHRASPSILPSTKANTFIYVLLPRGRCSFENKAMNAQLAGYNGVIIHNTLQQDPTLDNPIRMAATNLQDSLVIHAIFITYSDFREIIQYGIDTTKARENVIEIHGTISPNWTWFRAAKDSTKKSNQPQSYQKTKAIFGQRRRLPLDGFLKDKNGEGTDYGGGIVTLISLLLLVVSNTLLFTLVVTTLRNYYVYGVLHAPASLLRNRGGIIHDALKKRPRLPNVAHLKSFNYLHTERKEENECCVICIDEFVDGVSVRELPCGHIFHKECIDPWLMNHVCLCPTCKRDIPIPPKEEFSLLKRLINSISSRSESPPSVATNTNINNVTYSGNR